MPPDVFVSHSSRDKAIADAVCATLEASGVPCWIAPRNIHPGADWSEAIVHAISTCRVMVLVFSSHANDSLQVRREVQRAFEHGLVVIPLRIADIQPNPALEYYISSVHWLDACTGVTQQHLEQLTYYVTQALQNRGARPGPAEAVVPDVATSPPPSAPAPPLPAPAHNLPHALTSFVGREREIAEIKQLISTTRLLTLTGAGGSGKTRLAIQVASELLDRHADGVWLVELAPLSDPTLVAQSVALVLGIREEPGRPIAQTLTNHLREKRLLLILDNCEHLIVACAHLVDALLRACPHLHVLASSREPLNIASERVYRVPTLSVPPLRRLKSEADPVAAVMQYEAARLFVERATLHQPAFALTPQNAVFLAQICQRLDGIPLAIELAAARVKAMPVEQIARRLDDRFRLLTSGSRTALPRQQTLQATIDWSHDLLTEQERLLLRRLAVFVGSLALEAAEAVCAGDGVEDWEIIDLLTSLVDKSLIVYEEQEGSPRYRLLETVRQYSMARLQQSGETEALLGRHADYYAQMVSDAGTGRAGAEQIRRFDRLEIDHDNLRSALEWLLQTGRFDQAAAICRGLEDFWEERGWIREGRDFLERVLKQEEALSEVGTRAALLRAVGWFAHLQADYAPASHYQERSLALCREIGDLEGQAFALNNMAHTAQAQGHLAEARSLFEQSLEIAQRLGDEAKQAARLSNLGLLAIQEGQYEEGRARLDEARAIYERQHNAHGLAICLCNLADLALRRQEWAEAERLARRSLHAFRELNDRRGVAYAMTNLADAAYRQDDHVAAEEWAREALSVCMETGLRVLVPLLLEIRGRNQVQHSVTEAGLLYLLSADRIRDDLQMPRTPGEEAEIEVARAACRAQLGEAVWQGVLARLSRMPLEEILTDDFLLLL